MRSHLEAIFGTERDGRFTKKADAVRFVLERAIVLERANLNAKVTAIVGDREHDVIAGKANGIYTIGVSYGYGSRRELLDGVDPTVVSPGAI